MTLDDFAERAVRRAVPFRPLGRSWQGWDCWGLVWLLHREVLDIALPSYTARYDGADDWAALDALIRAELSRYRRLAAPQPGAVAVLRIGGRYAHVGVVTGSGRMLHVLRGARTCCERYDGPVWAKRLDGFYAAAA